MLFRLDPLMPATAYKTYQVAMPLATHWRAASCAEIDCGYYLNGWQTIVPAGSELEALVRGSGRRFTEERQPAGLIEFRFEPGQSCFRESTHRLPVGRPERLFVRDGDWRDNPTGWKREHTSAEFWQEDFAEHQDRLKTAIERG
jgi:hypothetical protein